MKPKAAPGAVRLDVLDIPTVRFLQRTAGNASVASLLASVGATRYPAVQRLPEDAFGLARTYSRKVYGSFDQLNADKYTFSAGEWRSIVDAYNRGSAGGRVESLNNAEDRRQEFLELPWVRIGHPQGVGEPSPGVNRWLCP
jgi:hypothetical protein